MPVTATCPEQSPHPKKHNANTCASCDRRYHVSIVALPDIWDWFGEKRTAAAMGLRLDSDIYHRIDNLIVPSRDETTEIDHVLLSTASLSSKPNI